MKLWFSRQVFEKILKYQISWEPVQWEQSCSIWRADGRTDRQTDMTKLTVAFRSFANVPTKAQIKQEEGKPIEQRKNTKYKINMATIHVLLPSYVITQKVRLFARQKTFHISTDRRNGQSCCNNTSPNSHPGSARFASRLPWLTSHRGCPHSLQLKAWLPRQVTTTSSHSLSNSSITNHTTI
jgi:hypothetical protein